MTHVQPRPVITVALFVCIGILGGAWFLWRGAFAFGIYGAAVATILGGRLVLSLFAARSLADPEYSRREPESGRRRAVLP